MIALGGPTLKLNCDNASVSDVFGLNDSTGRAYTETLERVRRVADDESLNDSTGRA